MSSEEAIKRIGFVIDKTINDYGSVMLEIATSANTMLQNRIVNTGYNAENRMFAPYSEKYAKYRKKHGRQTGFVDFTFSGRMWGNVQVVSDENEHRKGSARISTRSNEYAQILSGNTEKKGTILDLNQTEIDKLAVILSDRLTKIWHEQGL